METWLCMIETNCIDDSRAKEFNEWYDRTHLPDILSTPGVVRATRYEDPSAAGGRGRYLALYEIETDDILQTMAALGETMNRLTQEGRISELVHILSGCFYRQITAPVEKA